MFHDRHDAALRLARKLQEYRGREDAVVLAIPRGGLPIGAVLASELGLKLDVVLTKKIGHPDNPEFAIGAVSLKDEALDEELVARERIPSRYLDAQIARIRDRLRARHRMYHGDEPPLPVAGRTVILTDDGAATGRTLLVAIDMLRRQGAARIVTAIPVASREAFELLKIRSDEAVCLDVPSRFLAIGEFYEDFSPVEDADAVRILRRGARGAHV